MKRRRSREYALQILFQLEMSGAEFNEALLSEFWEGNNERAEVKAYTFSIVKATLENMNALDETIKKAAQHWTIERMAVVDKNILRAAACELLYKEDIPATVAINEAIEIAKKYSTEESASFINGILDKIAKEASAAPRIKKK